MQELTDGIRHWSTVHPNLDQDVSSYWLPGLRVLLDPLEVPEEVDSVDAIVLSNRHHKRSAFEARERFGCRLLVPGAGRQDFDPGDPVELYEFGEPIGPTEIVAHQVTELWPDDGALHIPSLRALAIADTVVNYGDELELVPDRLMGDAEEERPAILAGLARLAGELDFDHLLVAHGEPIVGDGRERLHAFAANR